MSLITTASNVVIKKAISKATQKPYYFFEIVKPQRQFLNTSDAKVQMALDSLAETAQQVDIRLTPTNKPDSFYVDLDFIV